jgi:isoquinoline 1-oxidoreductase beta subunit
LTTRREFLQVAAAAGGGVVFGFRLPAALAQEASGEINAWVVVRPDGTVIIRYARAEMGQGSMTSAAQLVAEELECDWDSVRVEYADVAQHLKRSRQWGDMGSANSQTIRASQQSLRLAGARARETLVAAAARAWRVPPEECSVASGVISHRASGRRTTYGRVAAAAAQLDAPQEAALKDPRDWSIVGKPLARVDVRAIVTGGMRYGIDTQLPGMVYAAVAHSPVAGGKVKSVDAAKVEGRRGVLKVLPMDDFVAVVADSWWRAREALRALPIVWDSDAGTSSEEIARRLREAVGDDAAAAPVARIGEPLAAIASAERVFDSEYFTPYLAQATLEPQNCTAIVRDGHVDVWTSTQNAEATHRAAAAAAGAAPENVYVHRTQAGGGFGRRGAQDFVREGVAIAKAIDGVPVKTVWTREEDLQHGHFRAASLVRMRAGLDAYGTPVALHCRVASQLLVTSQAVAALEDQPYSIPSLLVEHAQREAPVPVGPWRGGPYSQNPFVRECFIDELAHAAGEDPLAYRLRLLPEGGRESAILQKTAKAAGWDQPPADGLHRGIAVTEARGSYVAAVAELSVGDGGAVGISRLVMGLDSGYVVNPDNLTAQLQGSAAFMLSALFWGEITLKDGRVEQSNFHDYRVLRLAQMPRVEVVLAPSGGFWGGGGEPGVAVVAPAVANALFAATGHRIRSLPLSREGFAPVRSQ